VLLDMLKDPKEKAYWTNIVTTLGFIGDRRAVEPLISFVKQDEGQVDNYEFRAKEGALIHLGDLINKTANETALDFLTEVAQGTGLQDAKWAAAVPEGGSRSDLQIAAVMGLALSGAERAGSVFEELRTVEAADAPNFQAALDEAKRIHEVVTERGLAAYRTSNH
jgi:hypothetical protein